MKKLLKIVGIILFTIVLAAGLYIYLSSPKLPENSEAIIKEVLASDIPEFVKGDAGFVVNDDINIWYESIMPADTSKGAILLFMGIANDALAWPQAFLDKLVNSGYQVIRYDYRGAGFSDWVKNWKEQPYALKDLAIDARIILDSLNIEKVNLVGISMGGMVAQEFAINFPDRTNTLTSIMSSGNIMDDEIPPISTKTVFELVKTSIRYGIFPSDKNTIKLQLSTRVILRADTEYDFDVKGVANQVLYNLKKRKGFNPDISGQHHEATYRSGSRHDKLKDLQMPVLIIHGIQDPFIPIDHSKKLAKTIPHARAIWIENMAHDIPVNLIDTVSKEISLIINSNLER